MFGVVTLRACVFRKAPAVTYRAVDQLCTTLSSPQNHFMMQGQGQGLICDKRESTPLLLALLPSAMQIVRLPSQAVQL